MLLLCLFLLPVSASGEVIVFTAINDTLLPLTSDTMPTRIDSMLYVPYTVFDDTTTGNSLGVYTSYSRVNNTLTIYNLRQMLVFDLSSGDSYDANTQEHYTSRAVSRNGRYYVPVNTVCDFFGLYARYDKTDVSASMLLRITNNTSRSTFSEFIADASSMMSTRLREYQQSRDQTAAVPGTPLPPETTPDTNPETQQLLLAFRLSGDEECEGVLYALTQRSTTALFLFTPEQLQEHDDLVRSLLGLGHNIGITSEGETVQAVQNDLSEGNRLLSAIAHTATVIVDCDEALHAQLEQDGWICWRESVDARPVGERELTAAMLLASIPASGGTTYMTLDDSGAVADTLSAFLAQALAKNVVLLLPLETRL